MTTTLSVKMFRNACRCNYVTSTTNKTAIIQTVVPKDSRKCLHFATLVESNKLGHFTVFCASKDSRTFASNAAQAQTECPHLSPRYEAREVKSNSSSSITAETAPKTAIDNEWDKALPYEAIPGPKPIPILGNTWR